MKGKFRIILFVLILGTFSSGLITSVNYASEKIIAENEEIKFKSSILKGLDIDFTEDNVKEVFNKEIKIFKRKNNTYYESKNGDLAFYFEGQGLWGPIKGIIALEKNLETIKGIVITYQEETPGLGSMIAEDKFLDQFKGKTVLPTIKFMEPGQKASKSNEVDALSGATITGKALEKLLNKVIPHNREVLES